MFNLMEKAYDLNKSYKCDVGIIIFDKDNKLFEYADKNMDDLILKYTENGVPHKSLTNTSIIPVNIKMYFLINKYGYI